ncbi:MAG: aldehyde dehydrogenase family protein [Acidimicrobiia bacterium]|nr:aldehyde dehydrogenase family protein [Acidimicrobiia bacterium]
MVSNTQPDTGRHELLDVHDPATGDVIGQVPVHTEADVNAAVDRARVAAATWAALDPNVRRDHLLAFRRELINRVDELCDLIHRENGKPRYDAIQELFLAASHLTFAATRAPKVMKTRTVSSGILVNIKSTVSHVPLGVVGVIGPWNYPVFTPMGSIGYALAAGNAVVFKPSELTPLTGQALADAFAAAVPIADVFQVVTGDGRTGGALSGAAVDKLAFTGSAATGRRVMEAAARNLTPVVMELGGKDPLIVAADADVDAAADAAVFGALTNAGQACVSVERAYVVDSVYDRFLDKVVDGASTVRMGSDDDAQIGAITRPQQVEKIRDQLEDAVSKGAKVLVGGPDAIEGSWVPPTVVVDVDTSMKLMQEETFGPVLPVIKVGDAEEAIERANNDGFNLGSAVFGSAGIRQMADRIRAGMTAINSVMTFSTISALPFGGVGESGFGRIHGDEGIKEFTLTKSTAEQRFALPGMGAAFAPDNKAAYKQMKGMLGQLFGGGVVDKAESIVRRVRR